MFLYFVSVIVASTAGQPQVFGKSVTETAASKTNHSEPRGESREAWIKYFSESENPTKVAARHVVFADSYEPNKHNAPIVNDGGVHHYLTKEEIKQFVPTEEVYKEYFPNKQTEQNPYDTLVFSRF